MMREEFPILVLRENIRQVEDPFWLSFSGGLDSSLLAVLAKREKKNVKAIVVGMEESHDILEAEKVARLLHLPLKKTIVSEGEIEEAWRWVNKSFTFSFPVKCFLVVAYLSVKHVPGKRIVFGTGSEEVFFGYKKYFRSNEKAKVLIKKEFERVKREEVKGVEKIANHFGKEVYFPFLDERLLEWVDKFDEFEIKKEEKALLKRAILSSKEVLNFIIKKKKAAQYGSRIIKVIKKIVKG